MPQSKTTFAMLATCICWTAAPCATYWVSSTSDPGGNGTAARPYRTIQETSARMGPGDTCRILTGIYRETIVPGASGSAGRPVVYMADDGANVFVNAADPVTGWTRDGTSRFYKAPMAWDLGQGRNQVFVNGDMMFEARFPNFDEPASDNANIKRNAPTSYVPAGVMNPATMQCGSQQGAGVLKVWIGTVADGPMKVPSFFDSCRAANAPPGFIAGAMVHKTGSYWSSFTGIGAPGWGVEPTGQDLFPGWMYVMVNAPNWEAGSGKFVFSGLRCFLDAQREWLLDNGTLYFRPPGDADPGTLLVEAKRRQLVMDLRDRDYIEVRGIRFLGGSVTMKGSDNCVIDRCHFRYITHMTLDHGYRMDYRHNGESAFYIEGNNNQFVNSSIEYSAGSGIYLTGSDNLIDNNLIHDCDYLGTYDVGVCTGGTQAGSNTVSRNTMYNFGRSAWTITPGSLGATMIIPQKILYNDMYNCMFLVEDGGTIYLAGDNGGGSEIAYNWMYNMIQWWNAHHIYYDWGGGFHTIIHHNVFWQDSSWMAEGCNITDAPWRHVTYNNTFIDTPLSAVYAPFENTERGMNALYCKGKPEEWGVKDAPNRDFTLLPASKAIDKGSFRADSIYVHLWDFPDYRQECYLIDTPLVVHDSMVVGPRPDLGAYEYGKPAWKPGHTWGAVSWIYPPPGTGATVCVSPARRTVRPTCVVIGGNLVVRADGTTPLSVRVLDAMGRTVYARETRRGESSMTVPTRDLGASVLLVRVRTGNDVTTFRASTAR